MQTAVISPQAQRLLAVAALNKIRSNTKVVIDLGTPAAKRQAQVLITPPDQGWSVEHLRAQLLGVMGAVIQNQARLNNPATDVFYDGSPVKDPLKFRKSITVLFQGGRDVRPVMNQLLAEASKINGVIWQWKAYSYNPGRMPELNSAIRGSGPVMMEYGDVILLVPKIFTASNPDPTYQNVLYVKGQGMYKSRKGKQRKKPGYYAKVAANMRRQAKVTGFYVRAITTLKPAIIQAAGRTLPKGVPFTVFNTQRPQQTPYYQGVWGFSIRLQTGRSGRR
jgi:hypothetical protein